MKNLKPKHLKKLIKLADLKESSLQDQSHLRHIPSRDFFKHQKRLRNKLNQQSLSALQEISQDKTQDKKTMIERLLKEKELANKLKRVLNKLLNEV